MVLLGMDSQNVYVNDPGLQFGGQRSATDPTPGRAYPISSFSAAWAANNNSGVTIHPNPPTGAGGPPPLVNATASLMTGGSNQITVGTAPPVGVVVGATVTGRTVSAVTVALPGALGCPVVAVIAAGTASTTNGSTTITNVNTIQNNIAVGEVVTGTGVDAGTEFNVLIACGSVAITILLALNTTDIPNPVAAQWWRGGFIAFAVLTAVFFISWLRKRSLFKETITEIKTQKLGR